MRLGRGERVDTTWYNATISLNSAQKLRLIECLIDSSRFKSEAVRLSRTIGADILLIASYESWSLKTDNFCVATNVSRPTGRKLIRNYLEFSIAKSNADGDLFASNYLKSTMERRAEQFLLRAAKDQAPDTPINDLTIKRMAHALSRYDHAGTTGLIPGTTVGLLGLLQIFHAQQTSPRRTRNLLQTYYELTGNDLEPLLRRWILLGWVSSTDEHFFNDRFLSTTALGDWICDRVLETLAQCITRVDLPEVLSISG